MMQGLRYNKPLTMGDRLLIDTVTARYEGVETPFVAFDRGDHIELLCASTIRMTAERLAKLKSEAKNAQPITGEETSGLRLPNGAGAING